ncbi:hypothetical protein PVK06_005688 [Gossypium arboreum]|uniref:Uncharacterized protein n=1 Tax=Gossypium arboreum TaxID=29729 RepID=A0ABR0QV88_GOSAR|nr:hypothetical protein PVK06_005688 [Gossypium arboreum]
MSSSCGKKTTVPASKKRKGAASSSSPTVVIRYPFLEFPLGPQEELFQTLRAQPLGTVMTNFDDPGTVQFRVGGLVRQLSIPEFKIALGLYTEEFMDDNKLDTLPPQYRLIQSTEEEDPEDITDDVPPRHEDPRSQPPPIHRPVHAAASYSDISERLTRFV